LSPCQRGADRNRRTVAIIVAAGVVVATLASSAAATFVSITPVVSNRFGSGTLDTPTSVAAACVALTNKVTVSWTASSSPIVSGYTILRGNTSGGPYSAIGTVSGRLTTTFTDTIATLATQYYVVRATRNSWTSPSSTQAGVRNVSLGVCVSA
jgi:hypothetical protein